MVEYDRASLRYLLTNSPVEEQLRVVHALGAQAAAQLPGGRLSEALHAEDQLAHLLQPHGRGLELRECLAEVWLG